MFKSLVRNQVIKTLKNMVDFKGQPVSVTITGKNVSVSTTIIKPDEALDIINNEGQRVDKDSSYEIVLNDGNKTEKLVYTGEEIQKLLKFI